MLVLLKIVGAYCKKWFNFFIKVNRASWSQNLAKRCDRVLWRLGCEILLGQCYMTSEIECHDLQDKENNKVRVLPWWDWLRRRPFDETIDMNIKSIKFMFSHYKFKVCCYSKVFRYLYKFYNVWNPHQISTIYTILQ